MRLLFVTLALLSILPSAAEAGRPIVADLSLRAVEIDHNFVGIDILMFGARNDVGRIVAVVRGPKENYIVRKKGKIAGIWTNTSSVEFDGVSNFYAISSTADLDDIKNKQLLSSLGIGVENMRLKTQSKRVDVEEFKKALIASKQNEGLYMKDIAKVTFWGETLFRTVLHFPKNIDKGKYTAEAYLFSDGQLTAMQTTPIEVRKTGFEAFIFDLAHKHSLIYGFLCVVMAASAGWTANAVFGRM